jgi:hypothetical protein
MPGFKTILKNFGSAVCNDQRFAKLLRDLEAHCHDGTELHVVIDRNLPGLENAEAAVTIKAASKSTYSDSIRINTAIELFLAFLETERGAK